MANELQNKVFHDEIKARKWLEGHFVARWAGLQPLWDRRAMPRPLRGVPAFTSAMKALAASIHDHDRNAIRALAYPAQ